MPASPTATAAATASLSPAAPLTTAEAALALGISVRAVRSRILAGTLAAERVTIKGKPAYRIRLDGEAATATATVPSIAATATPSSPNRTGADLAPLVALIEKQERTILELSGRVGWLQAQLETAEGRIALLTAGPVDDPTAVNSGSELTPPRWQFWRKVRIPARAV